MLLSPITTELQIAQQLLPHLHMKTDNLLSAASLRNKLAQLGYHRLLGERLLQLLTLSSGKSVHIVARTNVDYQTLIQLTEDKLPELERVLRKCLRLVESPPPLRNSPSMATEISLRLQQSERGVRQIEDITLAILEAFVGSYRVRIF